MGISKYLKIPQYEAKGFPADRLNDIQELFAQAYNGRTISKEMLKWQMEDNPCLNARATSLWDGDKLIAYNALTPSYAILEGKDIITAVSGTTMADIHYPGVSLQLFAECASQNPEVVMTCGFPNRNSYGITVKYLGYRYVGDVAFWTATAKTLGKNICIHEADQFSSDYETISRNLSITHNFISARKSDYLNWRFFMKPEYEYHLYEYQDTQRRGYIVVDVYYEAEIPQLQIVDIIADSDEVFTALLDYARTLAAEWHCSTVKLWLTSDYYSALLKSHDFIYGEHPFPMTIWQRDLDISKAYLTMMNSDIF